MSETLAPTIDGLVADAARLRPNEVFLVEDERRVTFAELDQQVEAVARGLSATVSVGERIVLWLPNSIEFAVWFLGCVRAGTVAVPMNTELQLEEARYIVDHCGAVAVVTLDRHRNRELAGMALELGRGAERLLEVIVVEGVVPTDASSAAEVIGRKTSAELGAPNPDRPAFMLYTSGTTGKPKGAVHTHRFIPVMQAAARRMRADERDVVVLYLPMYHIYGLVAGLLMFLSIGGRVVLMRTYRPVDSLKLMEVEQATIVYGVPTTYIDQLDLPSLHEYDLSSVRLCFTPFASDLSARVARQWGLAVNTYGMTETAAVSLLPELDDGEEQRRATVGRPIEGLEVRIVDEVTGDDLKAGELGELLLRGPSITIGYHNDPTETARVLDVDGWFHTGDLASMDDDGRIRFAGRRGDLYRVGGELVDPVEVEAALQEHNAVARAAVLGIKDDRLGHVGHAWVQLREGCAVDSDQLLEFVRARLARFKVPGQVSFVESFPTTPSGKVQKFRLVALLQEGHA